MTAEWPFLLAETWQFGPDDPTLLGWATTVGYLCVAILCARAAARAAPKLESTARDVWPWRVLAVSTAALGANKELDIQTLLIDLARMMAKSEGWYPYFRTVRNIFLVLAALVAGILGWWLVRRYAKFIVQHRTLTLGFALVLFYCMLRAADLDVVGMLVTTDPKGHGASWVIEVTGISLMIQGASPSSLR